MTGQSLIPPHADESVTRYTKDFPEKFRTLEDGDRVPSEVIEEAYGAVIENYRRDYKDMIRDNWNKLTSAGAIAPFAPALIGGPIKLVGAAYLLSGSMAGAQFNKRHELHQETQQKIDFIHDRAGNAAADAARRNLVKTCLERSLNGDLIPLHDISKLIDLDQDILRQATEELSQTLDPVVGRQADKQANKIDLAAAKLHISVIQASHLVKHLHLLESQDETIAAEAQMIAPPLTLSSKSMDTKDPTAMRDFARAARGHYEAEINDFEARMAMHETSETTKRRLDFLIKPAVFVADHAVRHPMRVPGEVYALVRNKPLPLDIPDPSFKVSLDAINDLKGKTEKYSTRTGVYPELPGVDPSGP